MPSLNAVIPEGLQDKFQELVTQLKPGEVVIPAENGFYVFSGEHGKEVSFVDGEGRVPIEFRTTNPYYKPQLAYFNGMGLVGTDHVRITHVWDSNTQAWRELVTQKPDGKWVNEYVLLGNAEQRNRKRKERLFEAIGHHNLESVKSSSGDEIYIVVGGDYGLKLQGNVDRFKKILGIMMESNPGVTEMLIRFNVLGIAAGTTSQMFSTLYPGYMSSFRNVEGLGNIIECNERILTPDNYPEDIYGMVTVGEARGGYNFDHLVWNFQKQEWVLNSPDRVGGTDDAMLEKSLFFALWVKNDSGLPKERVAEMLKLINFDLPPNLQVSI
ncbi:MAG: hypothetical protein HY429_02300 [Candidatus Levybacteria bacterium]|nr:hypothetical protein [Candidatus Levybacteria bacterium]